MPIALGSLDVSKIYLGSSEIDKSYLGTFVMFPREDLLFTVDASTSTSLTVSNLDSGASYSGVINWGDGSADTILSGTGNTSISHTFTSTGVYQVRVSGSAVPRFRLLNQLNVVSLESLGNLGLQTTNSMFFGCTNLASVTIGNYVNSIDTQTFSSCSSLTSIIIPDSVISIGTRAFNLCSSLTSITIPDSVTSIGIDALNGTNLTYSSVDAVKYLFSNSYAFLIDGFSATGNLSLPSDVGGKPIRVIAGSSFSNSSLTSITIPNSVISIGRNAFLNCSSLTSVTIPNSVTSIEPFVLSGCSSLTSITIPNSVTSIGDYAFYQCSLTSITIPNSVTSIGTNVLRNCTLLATVDLSLPKLVIDAATSIFLNTASPLTLNVPTGTTGWTAGTGQSIGGNTNVTVNLV